jgi:hypothetical protein
MQILPKIILRPHPLVVNFSLPQQLDQHPNDLRAVEFVTSCSPGVVAQIVKDPEMPWGEDELDAVLDCLRFGLRDGFLMYRIRLPYLLGPTEDVIPASGERILAQGLLTHVE